jgi:hypothetical protein
MTEFNRGETEEPPFIDYNMLIKEAEIEQSRLKISIGNLMLEISGLLVQPELEAELKSTREQVYTHRSYFPEWVDLTENEFLKEVLDKMIENHINQMPAGPDKEDALTIQDNEDYEAMSNWTFMWTPFLIHQYTKLVANVKATLLRNFEDFMVNPPMMSSQDFTDTVTEQKKELELASMVHSALIDATSKHSAFMNKQSKEDAELCAKLAAIERNKKVFNIKLDLLEQRKNFIDASIVSWKQDIQDVNNERIAARNKKDGLDRALTKTARRHFREWIDTTHENALSLYDDVIYYKQPESDSDNESGGSNDTADYQRVNSESDSDNESGGSESDEDAPPEMCILEVILSLMMEKNVYTH